MSRTEDYLDGLLNSVASGTAEEEITEQNKTAGNTADSRERRTPDDDFLSEFEKDLLGGDDADEFLRQFEMELEEDKAKPEEESAIDDDAFFENLGSIVNESDDGQAVKELSADKAASEPSDDTDIMIDTIGDLPLEEEQISDSLESHLESDLFADTKEAPGSSSPAEEEGLMDLLQSEGEFSDIEEMLKSSSDDLKQEDSMFEESSDSLLDSLDTPKDMENSSKKKKEKKKKEKKAENGTTAKTGFWQKLSLILFGPEEEEETTAGQTGTDSEMPLDIENFSDDNLGLFQTMDGNAGGQEAVPEEAAEAPDAKGGKKSKKEKKEKKPKEPKAKKPSKEKPPKPPKEPDLAPRLPKVPVFLVFVMSASLLVLILVGTNLLGYTNSVKKADSAYVLGRYEEAYQSVAGLKADERDQDDFKKYRIMAGIEGEYGAYQSFMEMKVYDMALDSLIRTIGRCDKYREAAADTGCLDAMEKIRTQAAGALGNFGISEEQALGLYAVENRSEYSRELNDILSVAGLQKVKE